MAERARVLGTQAGGTPSVDASIWSQWQYLTEYPGVVRAEFGREYLALPDEVLVTVMRVHQKQLPIRDANEKLTNSFLAVLDNDGDPDGNAAYGNSFVTNARFADAKFFYETDRKRTLESRARAARASAVSGEARQLSRQNEAHREDRRGDLRRRRRRSPPRGSARPISSRRWSRSSPICRARSAASTRARKGCRRTRGRPSTITTFRSTSTTRCRARSAARSSRWPTRSTRWPASSASARSRPARRIRSRCAAPRRASCRSCSTATSAA